MELKKPTATVLGTLMGFDEQHSKRHAPRHFRVLSEGYLQRAASIGVIEKKSSGKRHPFRMAIEDLEEVISTQEVEDRGKTDFAVLAADMAFRVKNFIDEKHFSTDKMIQTSKKFHDLPDMDISPSYTRQQNYIFNPIKKRPRVFSYTYLQQKDEPCLSYSKTSLKGSYLVGEDGEEVSSSQNVKRVAEERERKTVAYAGEPIRQSSRVSKGLDESGRETRHDLVNSYMEMEASRSVFTYHDMCRKETEFTRSSSLSTSNWKPEIVRSGFFPVDSYRARESRGKSIQEKRMTEKFEPMLSKQGRKVSEMPTLPHHATPNDLNCKPVNCVLKEHFSSNEEHLFSGSPLCLSLKDDRRNHLSKNPQRFRFPCSPTVTGGSRTRSRFESLRNTWFLKSEGPAYWLQRKPLDQSSNKKDASQPTLTSSSKRLGNFACPDSASDNNSAIQENQAIKCSHADFKKQKQDSMPCILLETDDSSSANSSHATYDSIQQDASTRFDEECPAFAPTKEMDSITSLEEAYQPSPVSVLEPLFEEESSSSCESLKKLGINSMDLTMQLELLMSDSSGTNSEGPEMIVSSDDDGGEGSIHSSEESENVMRTFKFKDSRDFSYLVDVFTEAGLHYKNPDTVSVTTHGHERHSISPSVFETLEKKFGGQISWRRSERKLLFDRMNAGLKELSKSFVGVPEWAKPVSRRLRHLLNREAIEEELWILLDSQEREVSKDVVDKQFGKEIGWIDLGDEIDSICRKLESLLVEELVAEFDSIGCF